MDESSGITKTEIRVVETKEGFDQLEPEWSALLQKAKYNYPFLSHAWQISWWHAFGETARLFIVTVYRNERLIGIAPLLVNRSRLGIRQLEWIGAGRSDYMDFITEIDRAEMLGWVLTYCRERTKDWDILNLTDIYMGSADSEGLRKIVEDSGFYSVTRKSNRAPYLPITGSWEEYLKKRSGDYRKRMRKREQISVDGTVEVVQSSTFHSKDARIGNIFETAKKIEAKSWKFLNGSPRILTDGHSQKFYEKMLNAFTGLGWLEGWFILYHDQPIAYAFNFRYGNKTYAYNAAYDEDFQEIGAGSLLHLLRVKNAFQEGLTEYDFLRGEESYKRQWTDNHRDLYQIVMTGKTAWMGRIAMAAIRFRWVMAEYPIIHKIRAEFLGWVAKVRRK